MHWRRCCLLELNYQNPNAALAPSGTTVTPQFGGNISQVVWKVKGREKQAYTLKYDSKNRMTEAIYSDIGNSGTITGNRYDEKLTYDIRYLRRQPARHGSLAVSNCVSVFCGL